MAIDISVTVRQALEKLEAERARIDRQIVGLKQALSAGGTASGSAPAKTGRRGGRRRMPPAQRKAVGERMKAYWAKRRGAQGKKKGARKKK